MVPHHLQVQHAENAWDEFWTPDKTISDVRCVHSFLMVVMSHRIWAATPTSQTTPQAGDVPYLVPTWAKYYNYMSKAIQELNRHIREGASTRMIFHGIVDLLSVEVSCCSTTGITGCLTLVDWKT